MQIYRKWILYLVRLLKHSFSVKLGNNFRQAHKPSTSRKWHTTSRGERKGAILLPSPLPSHAKSIKVIKKHMAQKYWQTMALMELSLKNARAWTRMMSLVIMRETKNHVVFEAALIPWWVWCSPGVGGLFADRPHDLWIISMASRKIN